MQNVHQLAATHNINFERGASIAQFHPENISLATDGLIRTIQANLPFVPTNFTRGRANYIAATPCHSAFGNSDKCTVVIAAADPAPHPIKNVHLLSFTQRLA